MVARITAQPDEIARELRFVLNAGTRAASIWPCLDKVPNLVALCAGDEQLTDYEKAIAICQAVERAIESLGDGPYGHAAARLFGVSDEARGLPLPRRRELAANCLNVQAPTIVRSYQNRLILDVVFELLRQSNTSVRSHY